MRNGLIASTIGCMMLFLLAGCSSPAPVRVMSFNVGTATGGEADEWPGVQAELLEAVQGCKPDVLALQGVRLAQLKDLCGTLPEYGFVGVGCEDGGAAGEFVPIFYRRERFLLIDKGHFWLSDRPERVGSVGWDARSPRVATWVRMRFRESVFRDVQVVNVRFHADAERARLESARLLRRLAQSVGGRPLVVLGDFCCTRGSTPHRVLTEDRRDMSELRDAHDPAIVGGAMKKSLYTAVGTLGMAEPRGWILFNRCFEALNSAASRAGPGAEVGSLLVATLRLASTGYT